MIRSLHMKLLKWVLPSMLWGAGSFWAIGLATINEISAISPKMTAIENFMMICCEYGVALRTVDLTTVAYLFIKVVYIPFISIARYTYKDKW